MLIDSDQASTHYLSSLNEPQREAVAHHQGPILILAGAGSGKTRVLTTRIAHLVHHFGERPESIMAVTFTNKATSEMRSRVQKFLGERSRFVWVSTFHSAALRILRSHAHLLGYTKDFAVYDDQDSRSIMRKVLKELGLAKQGEGVSQYLRFVDSVKNSYEDPSQDLVSKRSMGSAALRKAEFIKVFERYQELLYSSNAMDFGDLLVNVVRIFARFPEVLAGYHQTLRFFLVDEFQDTNKVQYLFVRQLSRASRNLLVVGDDDQSIYRFRGASINNILNFEVDFPQAKVVKLEQNYRSSATIIEAGRCVIEKNVSRKEKRLWTANEPGAPIRCFITEDENDEASLIVREIQKLAGMEVPLSDIAIFYRTNAQSRALEDALLAARISYRIYGALRFYERKEVKDILAYLRLTRNPTDGEAFFRVVNVPARGIGPKTLEEISYFRDSSGSFVDAAREYIQHSPTARGSGVKSFLEIIDSLRAAAEVMRLGELVEEVLRLTGYADKLRNSSDPEDESRLENLKELKAMATQAVVRAGVVGVANPLEVLREFLDGVTLAAGVEESLDGHEVSVVESERVAVSLMTLHLAKGLEFPYVFLTGFEDGLIPHYRSIEDAAYGDEGALEEERRLCYVGITRAKVQLYLSMALRRGMLAGMGAYTVSAHGMRRGSRFKADIPSRLILDEWVAEGGRGGVYSSIDEASPLTRSPFRTSREEDDHIQSRRRSVGTESMEFDNLDSRVVSASRKEASSWVKVDRSDALQRLRTRARERTESGDSRKRGAWEVVAADSLLERSPSQNQQREGAETDRLNLTATRSHGETSPYSSAIGTSPESHCGKQEVPLELLIEGARVRHHSFGLGTVVGLEGTVGPRLRIIINFDGKGELRILASNAPLTLVSS